MKIGLKKFNDKAGVSGEPTATKVRLKESGRSAGNDNGRKDSENSFISDTSAGNWSLLYQPGEAFPISSLRSYKHCVTNFG